MFWYHHIPGTLIFFSFLHPPWGLPHVSEALPAGFGALSADSEALSAGSEALPDGLLVSSRLLEKKS